MRELEGATGSRAKKKVEENSFTRKQQREVEPISLSLLRLYAPPRRLTRSLHAMLARSIIAPLRAAARPTFVAPSRAFSASRFALDASSSPKPSAPSTGPVSDASTANAAPSSSSTQQNRTQAGVSHRPSLLRAPSQYSLTDHHLRTKSTAVHSQGRRRLYRYRRRSVVLLPVREGKGPRTETDGDRSGARRTPKDRRTVPVDRPGRQAL